MNERLDALLSARRDGDLEPSERAELDRLLSADEATTEADREAARARAVAFEHVDEALRALAAEPVAEERLARNLARLRERSGGEAALRSGSPDVGQRRVFDVRSDVRSGIRRGKRRGYGLALTVAVAVAAVWIWILVLPPAGVETGEQGGEPREAVRDGLDPEAEDLAGFGIDQAGDLEVIEELELLEFLAARERSEEGPRG